MCNVYAIQWYSTSNLDDFKVPGLKSHCHKVTKFNTCFLEG